MSEVNPSLRRAQTKAALTIGEADATLRAGQSGRGKPPAELVALFAQTTAIYFLADQISDLAEAMNAVAANHEGVRHG